MRHSEGTPGGDGGDLGVQWRSLVHGWAAGRHLRCEEDTVSVSLRFDLADAGRAVTVRFMTTTKLLVAFMTDGRFLRGDQLATAAAAANAWNTEQLVPMLSVWDVRGPRPCIAGVCSLPLNCRMDQPEFDALAGGWVEQARQMFVRCHQVFQL